MARKAQNLNTEGLTASGRTAMFSVELLESETPSPCDVHHLEPRHVIAMQRQRLQTFSTGRFDTPLGPSEFENIGRVIALPKGLPLHIRAEGGVTESIRCSFTPAVLFKITGQRELVAAEDCGACLNIKCPRIAQLLAQLAHEIENPGKYSKAFVDALGTALVIELVRYLAEQKRPAGFRRGGLKRRVFRQIVEFTNTNDGAVNLADLKRVTGVSERHLTRAFKESTGQTIAEYVNEVRLKRAIELLTTTDTLVADIAKLVGFRRAGAFCSSFARQTGESPGEFRRRAALSQRGSVKRLPNTQRAHIRAR